MSTSTLSIRIKNNLEFLSKKHNLTPTEISRGANVPQPTVSRLFTGTTEDPRASTLEAIANFFHITVDQLIGNQPITVSSIQDALDKKVTYLPIFSQDKSDELVSRVEKATFANWADWLEIEPSIPESCFAIEVKGDSMWPQFIEGTLAVINPQLKPHHRDYVLCALAENGIVLRQYLEEGAERLLKPINYGYNNIALKENDKILGVVIQSRSDFRR
jgi:SOS-response transcriptional repressor LexA